MKMSASMPRESEQPTPSKRLPGAPSEHPTARTRAAHLGPERRRPQILDVAFELFLERGYRATSMQQIAQAAGVSKPVVYACFAGKAELYGALLDREEQRMLGQLGAALAAGAQPGDVLGTLTAGFTAMLQAVLDTPAGYRIALLGGGTVDEVIGTRIQRGREGQIAAIALIAREWMREIMPPPRADAAAQFVGQTLVALGEAGARILLTEPELWTPATLGRSLATLAAGGYAALREE
jgi:AcrR family transcriptional regulator